MKNKKNKYAFTLPELLIVLTIIGIIASISLTSLKPAKLKGEALQVLAKKTLYDIDSATEAILVDNLQENGSATFTSCNAIILGNKYKTKLATTRMDASSCGHDADSKFYLKNGACIGFIYRKNTSGAYKYIFPGELTTSYANTTCAVIHIDTNGTKGPDTNGVDRYIIPLNSNGINYSGK